MTNILKYDIVVIKFPFASSLKYKARPAVVILSKIGTLSDVDIIRLEGMLDHIKVATALEDLQSIIPIDIVTHTKKMYEKFSKEKSSFSKEILEKGELLWGNR